MSGGPEPLYRRVSAKHRFPAYERGWLPALTVLVVLGLRREKSQSQRCRPADGTRVNTTSDSEMLEESSQRGWIFWAARVDVCGCGCADTMNVVVGM